MYDVKLLSSFPIYLLYMEFFKTAHVHTEFIVLQNMLLAFSSHSDKYISFLTVFRF
jgi:hypothetical protein